MTPKGSRVVAMAAPSQDQAWPDCPCRSLQGWKWSDDMAGVEPHLLGEADERE